MAKRSTKPLYELMSTQGGRAPGGRGAAPAQRDERHGSADHVEGGGSIARTIRLPVGWLLLGSAVVLLLIVGAYAFGFRMGGEAMQAELEADFLESAPFGRDMAEDPQLLQRGGGGAVEGSGAGGTPAGAGAAGGAAGSGGATRTDDGGLGPIASDPRQQGLWYVHVASADDAGARRIAEFCRSRGLAAYVVGRDTARRAVILTPGFQSSSAQEAIALRDRTKAVGEAWVRDGGGYRAFDDAYLSRHGS